MPTIAECASCHREERWTPSSSGLPVVEVLVTGGSRRPSVAPQWARGRTALSAFRGDHGPVVGVCTACGQLMVLKDGGAPRMPVVIDTPEGRLTIDEDVRGPDGLMAADDAEAWLQEQYRESILKGLGGDIAKLLPMVVLVGPAILWCGGLVFIGVLFAALYTGAPDAVSGGPGYSDTTTTSWEDLGKEVPRK